jgi:hypothetical protein
MQRKLNGIWLIVCLSIVFALSLPAAADDFIDMTSLVANVNAKSPGKEVIVPYFRFNDANGDDLSESLTIWYNVFKYNSTTKLYNSTPKTCAYPVVTCSKPLYVENEEDGVKFIRSGNWMITGINLQMECYSASDDGEAYNTFIYMADVSKAGGAVRTLTLKNADLSSLELGDYNGDGKIDLIAGMSIHTQTTTKLRILVKNINTWATISDKTYPISNQP